VNISISLMKLKLCSLEIIYNTILLIVKTIFMVSFIFKEYMSVKEPCWIFVNRLAWLGLLISRPVDSDTHNDFIYRGPARK
jgi:hypothetical protein